ncbi:MAG: rhamnan synthesis F family protein [Ruthenibacterium sp.]
MKRRVGILPCIHGMSQISKAFLDGVLPAFHLVLLVCTDAESARRQYQQQVMPLLFQETETPATEVALWKYAFKEAQTKVDLYTCDEIVFMTEEWIGPLKPIEALFAKTDADGCDLWSLLSPEMSQCSGDFWAIRPALMQSQILMEYWNLQNTADTAAQFFRTLSAKAVQNGFCVHAVVDTSVYGGVDAQQPPVEVQLPGTLLAHTQMPFLAKSLFSLPYAEMLCYGAGEEMDIALHIAKENNCYAMQPFYQDLLRHNNIYDLKSRLNLSYAFNQKDVSTAPITAKTALFIFLHYEELFAQNLSYLRNIPPEIDVYVITDAQEKQQILLSAITEFEPRNKKIQVLCKESRGRDLSALLVVAAPIIRQYDVFGFVHDKKTSEAGAYAVGNAFQHTLMHNMLASCGYIRKIVQALTQNASLGLLAPPPPIHARYFAAMGNGWTQCFAKTVELAQKLQLKCDLDETKAPYILGTAFWAKTQALQPLFSANFSYEDFPQEPLAGDGTLNHAIERIFPYVAQSEGYLAGWVSTEEYLTRDDTNKTFALEYLVAQGKKQGSTAIETLSGFPAAVHAIGVKDAIRVLKTSVQRAWQCRFCEK